MTKSISEGKQIPFRQRKSLSLLMGQPLDTTMTQPAMMSIMMANAPKGSAPQSQGQTSKPRASSSSMEKVDSMYATPGQARATHRLGS